jgi:dienelactone hydrolase
LRILFKTIEPGAIMANSLREVGLTQLDQPVIEKSINGHKTYLIYTETIDGLYTPVGLELPEGDGPFPVVLLASGNGGEGMKWVEEYTKNRRYTINRLLEQGYACGWIRYRTEVELGYNQGGKLIHDKRQGREMFNRSPLEYEDEISIIEAIKQYKEIDADKVGLLGMSHAGEMILKLASEYHGICAAVASEPAAHEFLSLNPDNSVTINPETQLRNIESMQMQSTEKVRSRVDMDIALERIKPITIPLFIMGRDQDELQGVFRLSYELLKEQNKNVIWKSYNHELHGYVYPLLGDDGHYKVNDVQMQAIDDVLAFFKKYFEK